MRARNQDEWQFRPPHRILGMKVWQVALLGGMALLDCLVLAVGAGIILSSVTAAVSGNLAAANPSPMPPNLPPAGPNLTPSASETPLTMVFQFPTYTPYGTPAETPTSDATPTGIMDGWVRYAVPEVEIWMPGSFAAGKPQTDAQAIIDSLKEKGANYNWGTIQQDLSSAAANYVLWGIDSHQGNPAVLTYVVVVYDFPNAGEPLAEYATRFVGAVSKDFTLMEQSTIRHPEYEVVRLVLETKDPLGTPTRVALYAAREQNLVWDILCVTAADEMNGRLTAFDQMVNTFRVLASP
jgi:hypothetical protein